MVTKSLGRVISFFTKQQLIREVFDGGHGVAQLPPITKGQSFAQRTPSAQLPPTFHFFLKLAPFMT